MALFQHSAIHAAYLKRALVTVPPNEAKSTLCASFRPEIRVKLGASKIAHVNDLSKVTTAFPNLTRIVIESVTLKESALTTLAEATLLSYVELVAAKYKDISALNTLPKLEQLNLTKSAFSNDLSAFTHLRRLILDQTTVTSLEFVPQTPTLEHWSLHDTTKLEDLSPLGRLQPGHRLHSPNLSGKKNLNLSSLAGGVLASTLTHLWLDRCTLVWAFGAPQGFRHLIAGFTQLSVLVFGSTLLPKVRGNWRQE